MQSTICLRGVKKKKKYVKDSFDCHLAHNLFQTCVRYSPLPLLDKVMGLCMHGLLKMCLCMACNWPYPYALMHGNMLSKNWLYHNMSQWLLLARPFQLLTYFGDNRICNLIAIWFLVRLLIQHVEMALVEHLAVRFGVVKDYALNTFDGLISFRIHLYVGLNSG